MSVSPCTYDNAQTYNFTTPTSPQTVKQCDLQSMSGRRSVFLFNTGSSTVWIAPNNTNLTAGVNGGGTPILPNMGLSFPWSILVKIYVICAAGESTTLSITDTGV